MKITYPDLGPVGNKLRDEFCAACDAYASNPTPENSMRKRIAFEKLNDFNHAPH